MPSEATARAAEFPDEELALPFGVTGKGRYLAPPADDAWRGRDSVPKQVEDRERKKLRLVHAAGVDPLSPASSGWGIVYPEGVDPAVKEALRPLIRHRQELVGDTPGYFQQFDGESAVRAGQAARAWLRTRHVDLMEVDPSNGVPLYLLLVGPPTDISFEFQYTLDSYWNVGRLDFDEPEHYAEYAAHLIAYERAVQVPNRRSSVLWNVRNPGDAATALLHNLVASPLAVGQGARPPVGEAAGFALQPLLAEAATKSALLDAVNAGTASFLFTGSHGMAFPELPEDQRREAQGALLCQEWARGEAVTPDHYLTGEEVLASANTRGLIHFLFACFGGGCPSFDTYERDSEGRPRELMRNPMTARLPQAILRKGALAVLAHIDRAWSYSFQGASGHGQYQGFRSVMERILNGEPIGQATDSWNQRWGQRSAELVDYIQRQRDGEEIPDRFLTNRWIERNDARNYVVLGDPAARLRLDVLSRA